jgi:hypothetical protein
VKLYCFHPLQGTNQGTKLRGLRRIGAAP